MDAKRLGLAAGLCAFALLALACGGGQQTAKSPARSDQETAEEVEEVAAESGDSYCSDGTCFRCGASFCPKGWYCDQKLAGGPACSWIPECAAEASCSCVSRALGSSCGCEERDQGTFVDCG